MTKIGFLGLGITGAPMARHVIRAGQEVLLWTHTPGKAQVVAEGRAEVAEAPPGRPAFASASSFVLATAKCRQGDIGVDLHPAPRHAARRHGTWHRDFEERVACRSMI
jgi:hypothetical protein